MRSEGPVVRHLDDGIEHAVSTASVVATADRSISPGRLGAPTALAERGNDQRRRGRAWLLHRALLLADVVGLSLAFVASQFLFVPDAGTRDVVSPILESL